MATTVVKLNYRGESKSVALFEGLGSEELQNLLQTVFSTVGPIVGFLAKDGVVIPLSLACKSPKLLTEVSECSLLVSGDSSITRNKPATKNTAQRAPLPPPTEDDEEKEEEKGEGDEDMSSWPVMKEILRFINELFEKGIISSHHSNLLRDFLFESSSLLFAGYSVAINANDSEYFAEICKDLAQSLESEAGRLACEAQEELLDTCDQLFINNKVTENQLLYLRHLVLTRDEAVAAIYDEYQEGPGTVAGLARALYDLVNTHPYTQQDAQQQTSSLNASANREAAQSERELGGNEDDNEQEDGDAVYNVELVIRVMIRSKEISDEEANTLIEMLDGRNEYVMAAYELFCHDENLDDFKDTLKRCARLEMRKQALVMREEELELKKLKLKQESTPLSEGEVDRRYYELQYDEEDDFEDDEEDDEYDEQQGDARDSVGGAKTQGVIHFEKSVVLNNEEDSEEEEDEKDDEVVSGVDVELLLGSLNIKNVWRNSVPKGFIGSVFAAVHRGQLRLGEARALCDLFQSDYDLVKAAWEVLVIQKDHRDFIDTVRRIVRDISLDDDGDIKVPDTFAGAMSSLKLAASNTHTNAAHAPLHHSAATASNQSEESKGSAEQQQQQMILKSKEEAMKAIADAKRELLKHSLEMMVSQGILTADNATTLFERALYGDSLVEAAIETYASDRDVNEFLDTLKILATHTPAELKAMLDASDDAEAEAAEVEKQKEEAEQQLNKVHEDFESHRLRTLQSLIELMVSQQYVTSVGGQVLLARMRDGDTSIQDAMDKYVEDEDVNALLGRLQVLSQGRLTSAASAYHASSNPAPSAPPAPGSSKGSPSANTSSTSESKQVQMRTASLLRGELVSIISDLVKANVFSADKAEVLLNLARDGDDRLLSISNALRTSTDFESFISALIQLANDIISASAAPTTSFDISDQKSVVEILARANTITADQSVVLNGLIDSHNPALVSVFQRYEKDKNVHKLVADVQSLLEHSSVSGRSRGSKGSTSLASSTQATAGGAHGALASDERLDYEDDEDDEDGDDDEEDDENDYEYEEEDEDDEDDIPTERLDQDDREAIERRFLSIAQRMELSHLETAALRLALARDNGLIRGALEMFRANMNESLLKESLRSIARSTISEMLNSKGDDDEEEDDNDDNDEGRAYLPSSMHPPTPAAFRTAALHSEEDDEDEGDDDEEEDYEDDEDDDDEDDEDEEDDDDQPTASNHFSGALSSQRAREHVFPILVSELVKETIISTQAAGQLMRLFSSGSSLINAALDMYDTNSSMAELVDNLLRIVQASRSASSPAAASTPSAVPPTTSSSPGTPGAGGSNSSTASATMGASSE